MKIDFKHPPSCIWNPWTAVRLLIGRREMDDLELSCPLGRDSWTLWSYNLFTHWRPMGKSTRVVSTGSYLCVSCISQDFLSCNWQKPNSCLLKENIKVWEKLRGEKTVFLRLFVHWWGWTSGIGETDDTEGWRDNCRNTILEQTKRSGNLVTHGGNGSRDRAFRLIDKAVGW